MKHKRLAVNIIPCYRWIMLLLIATVLSACMKVEAAIPEMPSPRVTVTATGYEMPVNSFPELWGGIEVTSGAVTLVVDDIKIYTRCPLPIHSDHILTGYYHIALQLRVVNGSGPPISHGQFTLTDSISNHYWPINDVFEIDLPLFSSVERNQARHGTLIYYVPNSAVRNELWFKWQSESGDNIRIPMIWGEPTP